MKAPVLQLPIDDADRARDEAYMRDTIAALRMQEFAPHLWHQLGFAGTSRFEVGPRESINVMTHVFVNLRVEYFTLTVRTRDDDAAARALLLNVKIGTFQFSWAANELPIEGVTRWKMPPAKGGYVLTPATPMCFIVSNPHPTDIVTFRAAVFGEAV